MHFWCFILELQIVTVKLIAMLIFFRSDGMSQMLGGCLRDFRNKPHPVRAKIEYFKNTLTVSAPLVVLGIAMFDG